MLMYDRSCMGQILYVSINVFSGYLTKSPRHNRFGACLFTPKMCLQNFRLPFYSNCFSLFKVSINESPPPPPPPPQTSLPEVRIGKNAPSKHFEDILDGVFRAGCSKSYEHFSIQLIDSKTYFSPSKAYCIQSSSGRSSQ